MSASNKRIRGLAISRPVLVGSTATPLSAADKLMAPPDHSHKWTVAIRSAASYPLPPVAHVSTTEESVGISTRGRETEADYHKMVGGKDDISYFIKRVQFKLHETYPQPTRNVDKPPFQVTETGWGEFEIQIKVFFVPEAGEKPLTFFHHLKLHPWFPIPTAPAIEPPQGATETATAVSETSAVTAERSATDAPAEQTAAGSSAGPSHSPADAAAPAEPSQNTSPAATTAPAETSTAAPPPAPIIEGSTASVVPQVVLPPVIHSWQYEEIVFPEPTEALYELLVAHPPSPLPPSSAQAFTDPSAYLAYAAGVEKPDANPGAPQQPPHPLHNPAGQLFDALSAEAIGKEGKRLDDARITVVTEIDNGRLQLIKKEKELRDLRARIGPV